jgi:hypothetical protein
MSVFLDKILSGFIIPPPFLHILLAVDLAEYLVWPHIWFGEPFWHTVLPSFLRGHLHKYEYREQGRLAMARQDTLLKRKS